MLVDKVSSHIPELKTRQVFLFLAAYFVLHMVLRLWVSGSAELDEAEQLLLTQELRLGYGSQPPLYSWIQAGLFSLLGTNILALALFKNCLLFCTYLFVYLSAREVTGNQSRAVTAMLSLLLIPQIFWESQRDLTHSVLGTTVAACSFYLMLRLLKGGRLSDYTFFGLCAGIGIISKYNFGIFLVAMVAAALSLAEYRRRILNRRFLLTIIILLLVAGPHLYWITANLKATLSQARKFKTGQARGLFESYLRGAGSLTAATTAFLGLLLPAYALFFYRKEERPEAPVGDGPTRFVRRTLLAGILLCILMILLFKVTTFKDRWMQPLLFLTPVWLVTLPLFRHTPLLARRYAMFVLVTAACIIALLPGRIVFADRFGTYGRLNLPTERLAAQLSAGGFRSGTIIAQSRLLGGNLKLHFTDSVVLAPEVPLFALPAQGERLIVWDASTSPDMPPHLQQFVQSLGMNVSAVTPRYIEAPFLYSEARIQRLGFLLIRETA